MKMESIEKPTWSIQPRSARQWCVRINQMLAASHWLFVVVFLLSAPAALRAQMPQQLPPDVQAQLQVQQQPVEVSRAESITVTAAFDPPIVRAGEKFFYRVTLEAEESSIDWPSQIAAPAGLKSGQTFHGQISRFENNKYRPFTAFACEMTATAAGHFTISNFNVRAGDRTVEIPAASIEALSTNATPPPPARRPTLEIPATNIFVGQPFHARLLLPAREGNQLEALAEVKFSDEGFMIDKTSLRATIQMVPFQGQNRAAFLYDVVMTPISAGPLKLWAQGFTAPPFSAGISFSASGGPITFSGTAQPQWVFLVSDTVQVNARPVPMENALPGYTGALGTFSADKPQLSTNRVRVGELLHLKYGFHGAGDLARFVPPAIPRSREWQIIADNPPGHGFTLIPLTDEASNTPAIPFCAFDPAQKQFINLTIPALPVTVTGEGLPMRLPPSEETETNTAPPKLSGLAAAPGNRTAGLKPLQMQGWFVAVQLLPVIGFIALWRWDERRRFLEAHPEIVRRRRAKRDLRREKIKMQRAIAARDAERFIRHAAKAMRIAVAPHFPADARALVGADVLTKLADSERNGTGGETVRTIFAAADAQFAIAPQTQTDLLALQPEVETVLKLLEVKL
jgi:hypothetical protein